MKDSGKRGRGDAAFTWSKDYGMRGSALNDAHQYKLDELAEIRARLFDGKVRSEEKVEAMVGRQWALTEMLAIDGIKVSFRKER